MAQPTMREIVVYRNPDIDKVARMQKILARKPFQGPYKIVFDSWTAPEMITEIRMEIPLSANILLPARLAGYCECLEAFLDSIETGLKAKEAAVNEPETTT